MHLKNFVRNTCVAGAVLALAMSSVFLTGCANMTPTALGGDSGGGSAAVVSGHLHGGNQPVAFAKVTLNYAGFSGQGSPFCTAVSASCPAIGSVIATTTSANDGSGSWSFQKDSNNGDTLPNTGNAYSCPLTGDPLVYILAQGGNTQNTGNSSVSNSASVFLAVLGTCKEISATMFINMSEVMTVASMAAMQQFFDPAAETFGADGINVATTAITNTAILVPNMVNYATGQANSSITLTRANFNLHNNTDVVNVIATPESAKINTIANIISSCVNGSTSSATACGILFANATPPAITSTSRPTSVTSLPAATDVLQAVYYMLSNPTNGSTANLNNLFSLSGGVGAPFQPVLHTAPSDWTIGISYSASNDCGTSTTTGGTTTTTDSGVFINSPYSISLDQFGDVWFANAATGNLSEIGPGGNPLVCIPANVPATSGVATAASTIDSAGNIWQGTNGATSLTRYTNSGAKTTLAFVLPEAPLALAADGTGNVFFSTATGNVYVLTNAAAATTSGSVTATKIATGLGTPSTLLVDNTSSTPVWATSGNGFIYRIVSTSLTGQPNELNGYITTQFTTVSPTYGIAVNAANQTNSSNNLFFSLQGANNAIANFGGSATSYSSVSGWPTSGGLGGISLPTAVAADAKTNLWIANNTNTGGFGTLSQISLTENALSPSTGFQKSTSYLNASRTIAIDTAGNVWVGGDGNAFITEIVGAAIPVYQPFAQALTPGSGGTGGNRTTRFQMIP